ncbi:adipogenesis regulatory factor isoform X1 [Macaca fascicularis]|uniref:adipogenesis regulatory factor isoform X1 n=1 Tax=Macaca fascicularis TaxID=9541 RepID=UPI003D154E30
MLSKRPLLSLMSTPALSSCPGADPVLTPKIRKGGLGLMSWEELCALLLPPAPLWTPVLTPLRSLVPSAPFPRRPVLGQDVLPGLRTLEQGPATPRSLYDGNRPASSPLRGAGRPWGALKTGAGTWQRHSGLDPTSLRLLLTTPQIPRSYGQQGLAGPEATGGGDRPGSRHGPAGQDHPGNHRQDC